MRLQKSLQSSNCKRIQTTVFSAIVLLSVVVLWAVTPNPKSTLLAKTDSRITKMQTSFSQGANEAETRLLYPEALVGTWEYRTKSNGERPIEAVTRLSLKGDGSMQMKLVLGGMAEQRVARGTWLYSDSGLSLSLADRNETFTRQISLEEGVFRAKEPNGKESVFRNIEAYDFSKNDIEPKEVSDERE